LARYNESAAPVEKLILQEFYQHVTATLVLQVALRPEKKRCVVHTCPEKRLPRGEIAVASAQNYVRSGSGQRATHAAVQQSVISADTLSPRGQNLIGEFDLFLVNLPLPQVWVGFGQENDVEVDLFVLRESIKERNPVGRDNLRENYQAALHAVDSR
jgi:hypothetical protein